MKKIILLCLLLTGCYAPLQPPQNLNVAQLQKDDRECRFEASKSITAARGSAVMSWLAIKEECLKARGYHE